MAESSTELLLFYDELKRELESSSERGVVILGAAALDIALEGLIEGVAVSTDEKKRGELFDTFSNKIACCYLFGLISEDERRELTTVRKIRNDFAHNVQTTLSNGSNFDLCQNLKFGEIHFQPSEIPFVDGMLEDGSIKKVIPADPTTHPEGLPTVRISMSDPSDPRERFVESVKGLLDCLLARTMQATALTTPEEFSTDEPREIVANLVEDTFQKLIDFRERIARLRHETESLPPSEERDAKLSEIADLESKFGHDELAPTEALMILSRYGRAVVAENRRRSAKADII